MRDAAFLLFPASPELPSPAPSGRLPWCTEARWILPARSALHSALGWSLHRPSSKGLLRRRAQVAGATIGLDAEAVRDWPVLVADHHVTAFLQVGALARPSCKCAGASLLVSSSCTPAVHQQPCVSLSSVRPDLRAFPCEKLKGWAYSAGQAWL